MEYTNAELLYLVERYKADKDMQLGTSETVQMCYFAKWLLSQNLQQCNVSGALPLDRIKRMFKYDDCSMPISKDDKLRKYGVAEYNKAISDVLDVLRQ